MIATTFFNHPHIKGTIDFEEKGTYVRIKGTLKSDLYRNSFHGIHVHEAGDLSDNCMGACAHFNPFKTNHGGPTSKERHVGDLGNNANGIAKIQMDDRLIKLRGTRANIIGRALVIHESPDDLGLGGHKDSLTTGHAGKRITCAVIGYSKRCIKT